MSSHRYHPTRRETAAATIFGAALIAAMVIGTEIGTDPPLPTPRQAKAAEAVQRPPADPSACVQVIVAASDNPNEADSQINWLIETTGGPLDYQPSGYPDAPAIWVALRTGETLGYAWAEDGVVMNTPECLGARP